MSDDTERCEKCNGEGAVPFDGEMIRCPDCDGNGRVVEGFL